MADGIPAPTERNAQIDVWVEEGLIAGRLRDGAEEPRGFSGWTELFMLLEHWRVAEPERATGRAPD